MRCPKCQYISYESGGRCRNCGYELSFAPEPADLDLPIRTGEEPIGPLADFELDSRSPSEESSPPRRRAASGRVSEGSGGFPLFREVEGESDRPLISAPAAPRAPVAVRKPPAPPPRRPEEPELELEAAPVFRSSPADADPPRRTFAAADRSTAVAPDEATAASRASRGARLGAAVIDLLLLTSIDAGVLYLTLRLTGVAFDEIRILPVIPFTAFLAMLNGGYLVVLTVAGGQTLGKMATGIKVINADTTSRIDRVPLVQAVIRAAALVVSLTPAGLGFLPALIAADGRALHDRLAGTRVVNA